MAFEGMDFSILNRVPQIDVAGSMGKGLQLRDMMQARKDDDAMRELSRQAGGDLGQLADLAQQKGLYKQAQGVRKQQLDTQKEIVTIQETLGKVDKQRRDAIQAANEDVGKMAAWADTPEKWAQGMQVVMRDHPIISQGLQPFLQFNQDNRKAVLTKAATVDAALKTLKPEIQDRNGAMVPVTTDITGQQTVGAPVGFKAQDALAKINQDEQNGLISAADAAAARKKATTIQPNMMTIMAGMGGGGTDAVQNYKNALLGGQVPWPSGRDLMDPTRAAAYKLALEEDPTFNANTHKQRATTFQRFTTGPEAQTLNKIGTALSHLSEYSDILERVPDVGLGPLNTVINKARGAAGNVDIARANTTQTTLANELEAAYRSGGGTEEGIRQMRLLLDPNLPLEARRANLAQVTALLQGKQGEMIHQYQRGMGRFGAPLEVLSPEAKAAQEKVLRRGGANPEQAAPQAPRLQSGKVWTVKDDSDFTALPSGAHYKGPDGIERVK